MRNIKIIIIFLVLVLAIFFLSAYPAGNQEIKKTFPVKKLVKISTITGDCTVARGKEGEIKVHLRLDKPDKFFKPIIEEEPDSLLLREKTPGGEIARWQLFVPGNTGIVFTSATGNFSVKGLNSDISASSAAGKISAAGCRGNLEIKNAGGDVTVEDHQGDADIKSISGDIRVKKLSGGARIKALSGDIDARELQGSFDLKAASGDVDIQEANGRFTVVCVSGDIEADAVTIKGESLFKVVSGDIYIRLSKSIGCDLNLYSASGKVALNYNGHPIKGYFEFRSRAELGKIISPFKFDKEEEIFEYGKKYLVKSFKREGAVPRIIIKTATGKAVLEK